MYKLLLTSILILSCSHTFGYKCGESSFYSTTKKDGTKIGLFATDNDFEGTPKWNIQKGEPPLSISSAVNLVNEWSETFYTRFDSVKVNSFRLQEAGCWRQKGNWIYVFDLTPVIDGNELHGSGYMVAVTMAGKILPPREF